MKIYGENRPRILVTGALCYLGQHLWKRLLEDKWHPIALVRPGSELRAQSIGIPKEDTHMLPSQPEHWPDFLASLKPKAAIHLASVTTEEDFENQLLLPLHLTNIYLPLSLGQALIRTSTTSEKKPLILAGSHWQRVNGASHTPLNLYAASKQAAEEMLRPQATNRPDLQVISLRLGDVYGPKDPRKKFISLVLDALSKNKALQASPGMQRVDLVHVKDVVEAFLLALKKPIEKNTQLQAYGVSSGGAITLRELVTQIDTLSICPCQINWGARPYRVREVFNPDPGNPLPNWQPTVSLKQGLTELLSERDILKKN